MIGSQIRANADTLGRIHRRPPRLSSVHADGRPPQAMRVFGGEDRCSTICSIASMRRSSPTKTGDSGRMQPSDQPPAPH